MTIKTSSIAFFSLTRTAFHINGVLVGITATFKVNKNLQNLVSTFGISPKLNI